MNHSIEQLWSNVVGVFLWNRQGEILEANDAFLHMVGYDRGDLTSGRLRLAELTPPEWREQDEQRWALQFKPAGTLQPYEKEYIRKDGSRVAVLLGAAGFEDGKQGVAFVLDLTERKRAAETLRETQMALVHANRVATMGQLMASIAHEISQPIATACNNAGAALNFLDRSPSDLKEVREALNCIVGNTNRAREIIDRIRDQIKKAPPRKRSIDINSVILDVMALTRSEVLGHRVSLQADLAAGLPFIQGDPVQLQQVILNLIVNALEAMASLDEGTRELWIGSKADGSSGVLVAVRDTGPGLNPNSLNRLFEAFYTTKSGGMGMGLTICRSIIEDHGGRLWATPNVPRGATFQFSISARAESSS